MMTPCTSKLSFFWLSTSVKSGATFLMVYISQGPVRETETMLGFSAKRIFYREWVTLVLLLNTREH